jgi:HEAT repeat protein
LRLLEVSVLALAVLSVLFLVVLAVRRMLLGVSERRRAELEAELRPIALAVVEEGEPPPGLSPQAETELARILGRYGRGLRGDAKERIARYFESSGALDASVRLLRHRRGSTRAEAAYTLGAMGSPRAVEPLLAALGDRDRDVRSAAAHSLGRLGAVEAVEPLLAALEGRRIPQAIVCDALLELGDESVPRLLGLVDHPNATERATAVELVGRLGDASDGRLLVRRLIDTSAEVRAQAALALGRLGADDAAAAVRKLLDDRIPFVRAAAAESLGLLSDDDAVEGLLFQAQRDGFEPARAAAEALARIAPDRVAREAERPDSAGPHVIEAADRLAL